MEEIIINNKKENTKDNVSIDLDSEELEMKKVNKDFPETWVGKSDYQLGNENFKFDLQKGNLHINNANLTRSTYYRDAEGNEITRERFYELRVEKLEETVLSLEAELSSLIHSLSQKVDATGVISAINISPESIRITGDKIKINGETLIENNVLNN